MRIFIPPNKTERLEWNFIYDTVRFSTGKAYVLNTPSNTVVLLQGGIYHSMSSITEENIAHQLLPNTMGDKNERKTDENYYLTIKLKTY